MLLRIENAQLRDAMRKLAEENGEQSAQISGYISSERRWARTVAGLESELRKRAKESPNAEMVRKVLRKWTAPRKGKPNVTEGGKRWKVVDHALKLGHTDPPLDEIEDELCEAIEGLYLMPFVGSHGRVAAAGPGCRRYDDVEHALRDEATIERFRGYARRARMSTVDKLYVAYETTGVTHGVWAAYLLDALSCEDGERFSRNGARS